jgi:hypothetical protein
MKTIDKDWYEGNTPFAKKYGCKVTRRAFNLVGLATGTFTTGMRVDNLPETACKDFPGHVGDHTRFWVKDGKPFAITTEPYSLDETKFQTLDDECFSIGLAIEVSDLSEWNPGLCKWIEIRSRETSDQVL